MTDQTSSTVILVAPSLTVDRTGVSFTRTIRTLQHANGQLAFAQGCTKTDPYGSNDCHWAWGEPVNQALESNLQEDISSGKLIGNLMINTTTPLQFSCAVCGTPCTISIPQQIDHGRWDGVWNLVISLLRHDAPVDRDDDPDHR